MIYNRPPIFPFSPMPRSFSGMPPSFPMMRTPGPRPGFGGFLSQLFSRGRPIASPSPWITPAIRHAAATTGAGANTGGGFIGMLTNIQKMLGVAQNVMPMVQQYGPLIKNLPAMVKIFRELKTTEQEENKTEKNIPENKKKNIIFIQKTHCTESENIRK